MTDIFVSYAREDQDIAQRIVELLERDGWSVWWDGKLRVAVGATFDSVIDQRLNDARCIVVLWSRTSVGSAYVKDEARAGVDRGVLVQVLLDDARLPLGFRSYQYASLAGWNGEQNHVGFRSLVDGIRFITKVGNHGSPHDG